MRQVLTGDEVRECWQEPAAAPEPFLGLFGSLEPAPAARPEPVRAPAPTAAVAAQRRWNEIVDGSGGEDGSTDRRGTGAAAAAAVSTLGRAERTGVSSTHPERAGPGTRSERPVSTWTPTAPVAAAPSVLPPVAAPDPARWRHPAIDERPETSPDATAEEPGSRRPSALSLLPATLANRLRRHVGTHGWRTIPVDEDPTRPTPAPPSAAHGATPIVTARPMGPGRLVEAPSVPPTGTITTLGDQLRRAERIRRERGLLDGERLRGDHGVDPRA